MNKRINRPQDLVAYRAAHALAMDTFSCCQFVAGVGYSLTDKILRSSRSVSSNLAEAWGEKRSVAHFTSK